MNILNDFKGVLFDLDGVLFIGDQQIEGAGATIKWLKQHKMPVRFLTNTTTMSFQSLHKKFIQLHLPIEPHELYSPPKIGSHWLKQQGEPKVRLILEEDTQKEFSEFRVDERNPDYIVLGHYGNNWNYDLMNDLFKQVMNGSKMLALHKGRYWQTDAGLTLDIGGFVAALEHATSQQAMVIGKPSPTFFRIALDDIGVSPNDAVMIGDDIINDIQGAQMTGMKAVLVKTGKYREDIVANSGVTPDMIIDSVRDIID